MAPVAAGTEGNCCSDVLRLVFQTQPRSFGCGFATLSAFFVRVCLLLLSVTMAVSLRAQDEVSQTNAIRFRAVNVFVDSKDKPLAAYQIEFTVSGGAAKIVGIEGGESAAFREAPFYDPKAMQQERVVIGAFSTDAADKLPKGKSRVATIHIQTAGNDTPNFEVQIEAAATTGGRKISAQASAKEKQRNEIEKASSPE